MNERLTKPEKKITMKPDYTYEYGKEYGRNKTIDEYEKYHTQEIQRLQGTVMSEEEIQKIIIDWHETHVMYFTTNKIVDDVSLAKAIYKEQMKQIQKAEEK